MSLPHQGELAALATAVCWTMTAISFEAAGKRVGSLSVNLLRLVLAFFFLGLFGLAARGLPVPTDAPAGAWALLSLSGLVGFVGGDLCLFRALVVIGPRLSTLIMSLAPVIAALLGWFALGERLAFDDLCGMALTLLGVCLVVLEKKPAAGPGGRVRVFGVLLALAGAAGQGGGLVISKIGMGAYDPFAATQIRVIAGVAGFSVILTAAGWWPRFAAALKDRKAVAFTSFGAFFGPFLGVSLSLASVQLIPAGVAQTIMSITPVLIIPVVVLLGREKVSFRAAAGAAIAVGGVSVLFL